MRGNCWSASITNLQEFRRPAHDNHPPAGGPPAPWEVGPVRGRAARLGEGRPWEVRPPRAGFPRPPARARAAAASSGLGTDRVPPDAGIGAVDPLQVARLVLIAPRGSETAGRLHPDTGGRHGAAGRAGV